MSLKKKGLKFFIFNPKYWAGSSDIIEVSYSKSTLTQTTKPNLLSVGVRCGKQKEGGRGAGRFQVNFTITNSSRYP